MNVCLDYNVSSSLLATIATATRIDPEIGRQELIEVPVLRIDDILAQSGVAVTPTTLLKFDVQDFELQALSVAPAMLPTCAALPSEVNVAPLYNCLADFAEIFDQAREARLRYAGNFAQSYEKDGRIVYFDALFQR